MLKKNDTRKNYFPIKIVVGCFFYLVLCSHSGRTDSKGGHYNRRTGEYHYHNGGPIYREKNSNKSGNGFLIFGASIGASICSLILILIIKSKIDNRKDEKKRKERLENEKQKKAILELTIIKFKTDYNVLLPLPRNIRLGSLSKCKFCKRSSTKYDCYITFLARTQYHKVCISCANKLTSLGKGQPIVNFKNEITFANNYKVALESLITKSHLFVPDKNLRPSEYELKNAFKKELVKRDMIKIK